MRRNAVVGAAVVAVVIAVLAAVRLLAVASWDPTVFTAFGEEEPLTLAYAEDKLGRRVLTRPAQGHDGKFFFVQANDPWLFQPEENAAIMDRPLYRSQRMLYPVLAGLGGVLPAEGILWALVLVNVVFVGLGSWAVARLAIKHGLSAWAGVAFALNVGLLSELFIDGAGIVAFSLACIGAWALEEDRTLLAAAVFAASALTREVMLVFVGFIALFWLIRHRKFPWGVVVPSVVAVGLWGLYLRTRLEAAGDLLQGPEATTLSPFSGTIDALTSGNARAVDYAVILLFMSLMVVVPVRAWRSHLSLTWGAVGFAVLGPFLTVYVWQRSFDISRALAPLVTAFILELLLARQRRLRPEAISV